MYQKARPKNINYTLLNALVRGVNTIHISPETRTELINLVELLAVSEPNDEDSITRCVGVVSQLMVEMIAKERFEQGEPWDDIAEDFPVLDPDVPVRDIIEEVKVKVEDGYVITNVGTRHYCKTENLTREEVIRQLETVSTLMLAKQYIRDQIEGKLVETVSISEPDFTFQVILDRKVIAETAIKYYTWD